MFSWQSLSLGANEHVGEYIEKKFIYCLVYIEYEVIAFWVFLTSNQDQVEGRCIEKT